MIMQDRGRASIQGTTSVIMTEIAMLYVHIRDTMVEDGTYDNEDAFDSDLQKGMKAMDLVDKGMDVEEAKAVVGIS